jgi:hypothetical protein
MQSMTLPCSAVHCQEHVFQIIISEHGDVHESRSEHMLIISTFVM